MFFKSLVIGPSKLLNYSIIRNQLNIFKEEQRKILQVVLYKNFCTENKTVSSQKLGKSSIEDFIEEVRRKKLNIEEKYIPVMSKKEKAKEDTVCRLFQNLKYNN